MSNHGPFHRRGAPRSDQLIEAKLLDAGEAASELELLRTVAYGLGVVWGHDELGAWAVVPNEPRSAFAAPPSESFALYRENDNRARFLIGRFAPQAEADAKAAAKAAELARGGHKQGYFVQQDRQSHK